ncbi:MAG TPA: efflux RND transporter periplasmic adaptor subunit [Terrimicrobiaceae bacterium]|nr:efflux RND transporter periplasmic adaptor subunit [Terrimicrobiaceae bacterium]
MAILALLMVLIASNGLLGIAQVGGRTPAQSADQGIAGRTEPSKTTEIAFPLLGQISEVMVKEGDKVEPGDVLVQQDVTADTARLKGLEAKANVAVLVELAERQRDLAKVELDIINNARQVYQQIEVRRAELEVEVAETRIKEQSRQGQIDQFAAEEQRVLIDQKTLRSPVKGIVEKVEAAVGEVFGPQVPAMTLVTTDPLHVSVLTAPASQVMRMSLGDTVLVQYEGEQEWREAKVSFISPVGEARSLPFKAELPNPDGRPAGLPVTVRLPS